MTRVGVVGAGITGLSLTHYLRERDVDCVTFEARERPGGVIRTTRADGRVLEHGPQRIRLTSAVGNLVESVGLRDELLEAPDVPLYVYAGGKLRRVPRSIRAFLTTDLLSPSAKLRALAEPLTGAGDPDETAAELFSRKFGREAYENLIGPLFGGIYGSDPATMPARHALTGLLALEERNGNLLRPAIRRLRADETAPAVSFDGGLQRLPEAIAERHTDRLHLGIPVGAIRTTDDGFTIVTDSTEECVDEVVVTTPAPAAADLLDGIAEGSEALRSLNYNPLSVVHLISEADVEGYGYQVRAGENLRTLGASWNASLFDRDGVYTCFLGGMRDPDVVERSTDEIGSIARREFEAVTGAPAEVANVTRLDRGFPAWDRSWDALDALELPNGVRLATNYTGRMGVPSRIREAGSIADELAGSAGNP